MKPYWENEKHGLEIYCGDCLEIMPELPAESIDFIVTSPPYALGMEYEGDLDWHGLRDLIEGFSLWSKPLLKPSGFCVVNFGETTKYRRTMAELYNDAFQGNGWLMHSRRIWKKSFAAVSLGPSGISQSIPAAEWEYIWTFRKPPSLKEHIRDRALTMRGVWDSTGHDAANGEHPASFPVWLPATCLRAWTDPGDLVLDPFGGLGTTLEACYGMGRKGTVIEQNRAYCERTKERIKEVIAQGRLFEPQEVEATPTQGDLFGGEQA